MKRGEQLSELPVLANFISTDLSGSSETLGCVAASVTVTKHSGKQDGSCVENLVAKTGPLKINGGSGL